MNIEAERIFLRNQNNFHPVVSFTAGKDKLIAMDFTAGNQTLTNEIIEDTFAFSSYISKILKSAEARFGIGGYAEHRTVYSRSGVFDADTDTDEPRRLHLGTDIWGHEGEPIFAPLDGSIHSFAFNDRFGDYGATIIIRHELEEMEFYSLYGHLSLRDIRDLSIGMSIIRGQEIAHFGSPMENGHWPPHLHFQLLFQPGDAFGDYPGVCKYSEKEKYLQNSPDPDLVIRMNRFISI